MREKTLALTAIASLTGRPVLTLPVRIDGYRSAGIQCVFANSEPDVPLEILRRLGPVGNPRFLCGSCATTDSD